MPAGNFTTKILIFGQRSNHLILSCQLAFPANPKKGKGAVADIKPHQIPDRILYFHQAGVTKLQHLATFSADKMVMLTVFVGLLKLGHIFPELMFHHQTAIQQQLDGVVKGGTADPVFVVLHFDVEGLHIEMPFGKINFTQNGEPLWCLAVAMTLQVGGKNTFHRLKNILFAFVFLHPQ